MVGRLAVWAIVISQMTLTLDLLLAVVQFCFLFSERFRPEAPEADTFGDSDCVGPLPEF